jgi:hypothetical protein
MKKNLSAFVFCLILIGLGNAEASYVAVSDETDNGSFENALNLDSFFDMTFDANIQRLKNNGTFANISNKFFHASVNATTGTGGTMDWYSFNTSQDNVKAYFDIDFTTNLNSWIKLYDSSFNEIGSNNDRAALDSGSINGKGKDSYLSRLLSDPGMYYVSVGSYFAPPGAKKPALQDVLNIGQNYTLHVSLASAPAANAPAVPVPSAVWLFGSGIFALLLSFKPKKAISKSSLLTS